MHAVGPLVAVDRAARVVDRIGHVQADLGPDLVIDLAQALDAGGIPPHTARIDTRGDVRAEARRREPQQPRAGGPEARRRVDDLRRVVVVEHLLARRHPRLAVVE